jgi:TRAP-type C4-dicarboxylate transport system permease small subunit
MASFIKTCHHGLSTASRSIDRLVANLCVLIVYVMLVLLMTQVIMRYFLGSPPSWTEELAINFFTWLVLLFASVGIRNNFHVALDTIPDRFGKLKTSSDFVVTLLIAGFSFVMIYSGSLYVSETLSQKTAALQIPIATLYVSVPVSGVIIFIHCLSRMLGLIAGESRGSSRVAQEIDV